MPLSHAGVENATPGNGNSTVPEYPLQLGCQNYKTRHRSHLIKETSKTHRISSKQNNKNQPAHHFNRARHGLFYIYYIHKASVSDSPGSHAAPDSRHLKQKLLGNNNGVEQQRKQ